MRILVIEDELNLQADIKAGLESAGYTVDCSSEGNEGYFFASEYPLDAAIVDIGLPAFRRPMKFRKFRKFRRGEGPVA